MNKHSRKVDKKGWCDKMQSDVREWLRAFGFRFARGEGEQLPISDSESGPITPKRGVLYGKCCSGSLSESATFLAWSLENAESELFSILLRHDSRRKFDDLAFLVDAIPLGCAAIAAFSTGR